jgi:hypothetical protein
MEVRPEEEGPWWTGDRTGDAQRAWIRKIEGEYNFDLNLMHQYREHILWDPVCGRLLKGDPQTNSWWCRYCGFSKPHSGMQTCLGCLLSFCLTFEVLRSV